MGTSELGVTVVSAEEDGALPAEVTSALAHLEATIGARIVRRVRVGGLTETIVADERLGDSTSDLIVPVLTPWLLASGWLFTDECRGMVARHGQGKLLVLPLVAGTVGWGGTPLAGLQAAPLGAAAVALGGAAAELLGAGPADQDGLVRSVEPAPKYDDDARARVGARVWGLFSAGAHAAGVDAARALRTGPLLRAGEVLEKGRFRLIKTLGRGTLTTAWQAWDRTDGRLVVVKVLHGQFATDRAQVERMWDSVARAASLSHPNLVAVVQSRGDEQGFPYFVCEYLDGGDLEAERIAGRVTSDEAIQAVLDAAAAVEHAHAAGLLHRDLKPANILLSRSGPAKVVDFDLLVDVRGDLGLGSVYTAPETMEPGYVPDARSDVYALGMTVAFALHGQALPFWVLRSPDRLIASLGCSETVRAVIRAAVDWDLATRLASVAEFKTALLADHDLVRRLAESAVARGQLSVACVHWRFLIDEGASDAVALRRRLAAALEDLGQPADAAAELLSVLQDADVGPAIQVDVLTSLRRVCAATGAWDALTGALERLIDAGHPRACEFRVEIARLLTARSGDEAAIRAGWERVLTTHATRGEAREALGHLVRLARLREDWASAAHHSKALLPFVDAAVRPVLQAAIGTIYLERLDDQGRGVLWLERAHDGGYAEPAMLEALERIRSARGEWKKVVQSMREQARRQPRDQALETLLRAARITLFAHHGLDQVLSTYEQVLELAPGQVDALRFAARYHSRAGRSAQALGFYGRMDPSVGGVDDRVADAFDRAQLLAGEDRTAEAIAAVEDALVLSPNHVPALELAIELYGADHDGVRRVAERIVTATSSVRSSAPLRAALLALGDVAWLACDLASANDFYQRALAIDPNDRAAWWCLAKTALYANGVPQRDGSDVQSPWLHVAPVRFTPHEALARMFAGLFEPASMSSWLQLVPGAAPASAAAPPLVLAGAVVDQLARRRLMGPGVFQRLASRFPAWKLRIDAVRRLWCEPPGDHAFVVAESYSWGPAPLREFDRAHHRDVLHLDPPLAKDVAVADRRGLTADSAWEVLFARQEPLAEPTPDAALGSQAQTREDLGAEEVVHGALVTDEGPSRQRVLACDADTTTIGSAPGNDFVFDERRFAPVHVVVHRCGTQFYAEDRSEGRGLLLNGAPIGEARVEGGDVLSVDDVQLRFVTYSGDRPPFVFSTHDDATVVPDDDAKDEPAAEVPSLPFEEPTLNLPIPSLSAAPAAAPAPRRAALFQRETSGAYMFSIAKDVFTVGTKPTDDIKIGEGAEGAVSARITRKGTDYFVDDAQGVRALVDGDRIVVGPRTYEFAILTDKVPAFTERRKGPVDQANPAGLILSAAGETEGRVVHLKTLPFTIGRGRDANLQINNDASLSRVHCKIDKRGSEYMLHDCGSSNGTILNGEPVTQHRLATGDLITIGATIMEFQEEVVVPSASAIPTPVRPYYPTGTTTEPAPMREVRPPTVVEGLSVEDGLARIAVANGVLSVMMRAYDRDRAGSGVDAMQVAVDGCPTRLDWLYDDVRVGAGGLPAMQVMYNVGRRPSREQRRGLNSGLLDLIERALAVATEALPATFVGPMLEDITRLRHREELRE